ncbi:hypothetical protein LR004_00910 [Candidatus Gracilibacteria bacterium]|nr:hypothetical protein [Candidatus Gracilibacteria bacterium]
MEILLYIIGGFTILIFLFFVFLKYREHRIKVLEEHIKSLFLERSALIPAIYEISKPYLTKHDDIFSEVLKLRKREFLESTGKINLHSILQTKKLIHHEINFIFKICNKHHSLIKEGKFIYLRNLIIEKSNTIGTKIELYKKITSQQNKLITWKNITVIGFFMYISKKVEI